MAFKAIAGAGEEKVFLETLLTSRNPDEIEIGKRQWAEIANKDPQAFKVYLTNTLAKLNKDSNNKGRINLKNLEGLPKKALDGVVSNAKSPTSVPVTNAPTPKTVDDALKAPTTAETNTSSETRPWGSSRSPLKATYTTPEPVPAPSSSAPSSSSSSAPYYYVRGKDGTGKIYEGEDIYKAVPREAFGTVEPTSAKGAKKGTIASKPSATASTTGVMKGTSSPAPKSVDSVIKPKSTPKPTPKVAAPSTVAAPTATAPASVPVSAPLKFTPKTLPIPSVSTTPSIATPYNSLSPSVYDTVTPTSAPVTRPVDSVIKPAPAPAPAPVAPVAPAAPAPVTPAPTPAPVAPAPAPASTPASAPTSKTIATPKLFSIPSASTPASSPGPLLSASSAPVATPAGSSLSSSVYGTVTPTPTSAPTSASTAATSTPSTPSTTASSSTSPTPKPTTSGATSGPKPAVVDSPGPIRPSAFVDTTGKALKYGSRALLAAAVVDDAIKRNDAGALADLIMAIGGRPGGIIGGILHPTELANSDLYINGVNRYDKNLAPSALANVGLNGQSAGIGAVAASREKENNQEMEDLFDTFSSLGAEPYGEVPFIMASNGVPYFQDEKGFTQQPYENPQSLSYTYFNGEQHPMNDPGEITDANRSISMPTKKATITTAPAPATTTSPTPAPARRRRRQAASPMEVTIATPSPREQLAAQRAAALNNARLQQQQAAAQYAALNAPKPGFNPSGYATGHEAYYDPYKSQLLFR